MKKLKSKYVYICAAGHSGSTLLDLLLGANSEGVSVGEITQLPKNITLDSLCSCGQNLSTCEFWHKIITSFSRSIGVDLWKDPYRLNLGFIKAGHEIDPGHQTRLRMMLRKIAYGASYAQLRWNLPAGFVLRDSLRTGSENKSKLFQFILDTSQREFIVDSSKHYLGGLSLYQAAPDETKVIHLLRDGRAVLNSGLNRGMPPKAALDAWARHCRRSLNILSKHLPDTAMLTVHYETLASRPEPELQRISAFLGITYDPKMLEFDNSNSHIANGNRMRFARSSEIKLDERWRDDLSEPMLQYFDRRAGQLNRQLGYLD